MKLIIPKYKLENLIIIADSIVENKISSVIFSNMILEAFGNKLYISASDSQITFKANDDAEVIDEGRILVNAKMFSEIIRVLPDDDIEITTDQELNVRIKPVNKEKQLKFELKGIVEDEYKLNIEFDEKDLFQYKFDLLKEMISKVIFAAADNDPVFSLNGVYLEAIDNKLSLVATDKKRLSYVYQFEDESRIKIVVPKKFFHILNKIKTSNENIMIGLFQKKIIMMIDKIVIQSYLLEPNFPNYKNIIPKDTKFSVKINLEEFKRKLRIISPMINPNDDSIIFDFDIDKLHIHTKATDIGNVEDFMSCEFRQDAVTLYVSHKNIFDTMKVLDCNDFIMEFDENPKTILIKPSEQNDDYNFIYITVSIQL